MAKYYLTKDDDIGEKLFDILLTNKSIVEDYFVNDENEEKITLEKLFNSSFWITNNGIGAKISILKEISEKKKYKLEELFTMTESKFNEYYYDISY